MMKFPFKVNSWFRSAALNQILGGSKTSDHMTGRAVDITTENNKKVFDFIRNNLTFDQLIWEEGDDNQPAWIHVSYREGNNRNQVLRYRNKKYEAYN
jgi:hypothetical protein